MFQVRDLTLNEQKSLIEKNIYNDTCPIKISRLKIIEVKHYNFAHKINDGKIMCFDVVAPFVANIFKELYIRKFPIYSVKLIDDFNGDDDSSMAANNSSCFNFRKILNSDNYSLHSYGMAIDINPVQNPYIVFYEDYCKIMPPAGKEYLNRREYRPAKNNRIGLAEEIIDIFYNNGFRVWGGNWDSPIDWQHFQVERKLAEQLAQVDLQTGKEIFSNFLQQDI